MALRRALVLGEQVHLHLRHARALAQVVVAHQAVEAVGSRRPDVDLIVGDLLLLADGGGDLPGHLRGAFQRAVLGHVEDDLQLALVVVGQHLDPHPPGGNEGHRSQEEQADHAQERPAPDRTADQPGHEPAVGAGGTVLGTFPRRWPSPAAQRSRRAAAQGVTTKATRSEKTIAAEAPTGIGRMYGPIRPPTNAIGRMAAITVSVASMVGLPTSATARTAISRSERRLPRLEIAMPDDVLDHHDRVVDQDADREDQREERDPVERVAEQVEDQERQRQGRGNGDRDHHRLAPAEHEQDQERDRPPPRWPCGAAARSTSPPPTPRSAG